VHQVIGSHAKGSRGAFQVDGGDTCIWGRRFPQSNVNTVSPKGVVGEIIQGMLLKVIFVRDAFVGNFFRQGVSLTMNMVEGDGVSEFQKLSHKLSQMLNSLIQSLAG